MHLIGSSCRSRAQRRSLSLTLRAAVLLTTLVGSVAACTQSDDIATDTTVVSATTATTASATTTPRSTTTTVAASTSDTGATAVPDTMGGTTKTIPETTTTLPPEPVYPLTGVANPDPIIAARPALVVKIDNAPGARPQTGFNSADIVYEEIVNDNLTRFAMVFQSHDSNPVGPIRSGRLQDVRSVHCLRSPTLRLERR